MKDKLDEKCSKLISYKINNAEIETLFFGTSRVDYAINSEYYTKQSGKIADNMGIIGLQANEIIDIFEKITLIHPEVKNIYAGLDFLTFGQEYVHKHENRNKIEKYITPSEIGASLLSLKTTGDSILCIARNFSGKKRRMWHSNGTKMVFVNENIKRDFYKRLKEDGGLYKKYKLNQETFKIIEQLKTIAEEKNINIRFFIMPTHITDEYLIYKYAYNDYKKWKKYLAEYNIYDFHYPNPYTEEPITPDMKYFFEASHATHYLGDIILDVFMGGGKNTSFGHKLTPDNVEKYIKEDEQNLENYINAHKDLTDWADKII